MSEQHETSRNLWPLLSVAGIFVLLLIWVFFPGNDVGSVSTSGLAAPDAKAAEQQALADARLFASGDFAGHYAALARSDRAQVTEDEWVRRCTSVVKAFGKMTGSKVVKSWTLGSGSGVEVVELELTFAKAKKPVLSRVFYVMEAGGPRQSMLWGRTLGVGGTLRGASQ